MKMRIIVVLNVCFILAQGEKKTNVTRLQNGLEERIGNFSTELLYHASLLQPPNTNLIISPLSMWSVLALISDGALGKTRYEIRRALRTMNEKKRVIRQKYVDIAQWLQVKTKTIDLTNLNALFHDKSFKLFSQFREVVGMCYKTPSISLDFDDSSNAANRVNDIISKFTHGRINKVVDDSHFKNSKMIITSSLYFKGQWTLLFDATSTEKKTFYDNDRKPIGEVNMMFNKAVYPLVIMKPLKATVIELPYGKDGRLSMVVMLPNYGVSLDQIFYNLQNVKIDKFMEELRISIEKFPDDEVDCLIPRFKIESNLDMTNLLRDQFGIRDLFDENRARLPFMTRMPLFVSRIVQKAEIEVSEQGTTAAAVTVAEFIDRVGNVRFEANRPFAYMIVEKVTNTIVFGGFYEQPSLY